MRSSEVALRSAGLLVPSTECGVRITESRVRAAEPRALEADREVPGLPASSPEQ